MVTDDDVEEPTRRCRVGGLSASTYFLIVLLWIPSSRSIARSDIPLRLAFRIAFPPLLLEECRLAGWGHVVNHTWIIAVL